MSITEEKSLTVEAALKQFDPDRDDPPVADEKKEPEAEEPGNEEPVEEESGEKEDPPEEQTAEEEAPEQTAPEEEEPAAEEAEKEEEEAEEEPAGEEAEEEVEEEEAEEEEGEDVLAPLPSADEDAEGEDVDDDDQSDLVSIESSRFVTGGNTRDSDNKELGVAVTGGSARLSAEKKEPSKPLRMLLFDLGNNDADVVMEAMKEITAMELHETHAKNNEHDRQLVAKGAAPLAVLQALRNHAKERADIASKGLGLLLSLTATNEKGCGKAIKELDGSLIIIDIMREHSENVNIQVHGLGLLSNLSSWGKKEVLKIFKDGGVEVVLADMKKWPKVAYVQRRACKVLANMTAQRGTPHIRSDIRTKKGLSVIGKCIETFPTESSTFMEARRAMQLYV